MPKIKNQKYVNYLNRIPTKAIIKDEFIELIKSINYPTNPKEARIFCIILWATGARPNEVVRLRREDFTKEDSFVCVSLPGSKGSFPRRLYLPGGNVLVKEVSAYANLCLDNLFPTLLKASHRPYIQKKDKQGSVKRYFGKGGNGYNVLTKRLNYYFKKWFDLPPYIFRHNRLIIAAETLNLTQLKELKGAKTEASVYPYLGLTIKKAREMGRELVK